MGKKVVDSDKITTKADKKAKKNVVVREPEPDNTEDEPTKLVAENSKKIKKESFQIKAEKKKKTGKGKPKLEREKEEVKANIEPLNENKYSEFVKTETLKYAKLRKRTIEKISLDKTLIKKAAKALLTHHENLKKKSRNLLDTGDDFIYLEIVMSQVPTQYSIKPIQIKLPVPIYGQQFQSRFAIFSTDPQRAFKDKIQDLDIPCIAKVIGYTKLVKNYPQYNDKRKLIYDYDQFFCDYKLYNLLRKPTGKIFYERKKIPFPIDCNDVPEHLKSECPTYQDYLNSLGNFTYFIMGNGPVYTVKVARVNMDLKDIVKNIIHGAYNTIPHILKESIKHTKVRQISIKTSESISLPILNQLTPEEIGAIRSEGDE